MTLRFVSYEIAPIIDDGKYCRTCYETPERADYFSVYGRLPVNEGGAIAVCIGDFNTQEAAELVVEFISGQAAA